MRMLAGFEEPTNGRILLQGKDISGVPPYKRPTNMMFQSYALFPHMSVEKNIAFGLEQDGLPKAEISSRVEEMLRLVKLSEFAKRKPSQLAASGSAWRLPARLPSGRRCFCWMNRSVRSTRSCARKPNSS